MPTCIISVDGQPLDVPVGATVAAALWNVAGRNCAARTLRRSTSGMARGPLCAMGICFECRVTIDGAAHRRACMERCRAGMEIVTGG